MFEVVGYYRAMLAGFTALGAPCSRSVVLKDLVVDLEHKVALLHGAFQCQFLALRGVHNP